MNRILFKLFVIILTIKIGLWAFDMIVEFYIIIIYWGKTPNETHKLKQQILNNATQSLQQLSNRLEQILNHLTTSQFVQ